MQNIINFYENFKIDNDNFDLKSLKTEKKMLGKKYITPIGSVYGSGGGNADSGGHAPSFARPNSSSMRRKSTWVANKDFGELELRTSKFQI